MARLLDQLVGHRDTLQPLFDAKKSGRLASTLLFAGPSGVGKRLAARALSQALICERSDGEACGECGSCLRVEKDQSESLLTIAPEGAQIKIEQARDVLQFLSLQKMGKGRVVLIDQAHLLNPQAGNALLKSLEEPPEGTHFILITALPASVLSTIRSRSQFVRFRPLADQELSQILGPEADAWLVAAAHGSVEAARRLQESREEFLELENTMSNYLLEAAQSLPVQTISRLKDLTKDRAAQAFVASLLQGVLRDSMRLQAGVGQQGSERLVNLIEFAAGIEPFCLRTLADQSIEFEHDLARNVDRGLIFENFAIQWRLATQTTR